jgi:hypothetical protein
LETHDILVDQKREKQFEPQKGLLEPAGVRLVLSSSSAAFYVV